MMRERGFWLMLLDGLVHIFRILEKQRLWKAWVFYPCWAPDFVFGLGYPLSHHNDGWVP